MGVWLRNRAVQWWWIDAPLCLAVAGFLWWRVTPASGVDLLGRLALVDRRSVYTDLVQVTAIFAAFGGATFAIYFALNSPKIKQAKKLIGSHLIRIWLAALASPWFCSIAIVLAKVTDRDSKSGMADYNFSRWLVLAAVFLTIIQLARMIYIFYQLAMIDVEDSLVRETSDREIMIKRDHAH
ncbi:hypothetical protein [Nonomuraea guangzhouensis]|uniref:DUF4328 domain-containing protein n=1 Tax=Nonomuraea guangzhouensis TaxID=1291555 RepID=A0ABW4GH08_9ACTN|nr:hypothetical protein [Nonomuraea guangzhouensis]